MGRIITKIDFYTITIGIILAVLACLILSAFLIPALTWKDSLVNLKNVISKCPYSIMEYQENVFDCSNMGNMLDDWLEYHGYESWIIRWSKINPLEAGHIMLLVDGHLVEPTQKCLKGSLMDLAQEGDWSNQLTIFDEPTQLSHYIESEWSYPKRW